jgi:hypothetical protein
MSDEFLFPSNVIVFQANVQFRTEKIPRPKDGANPKPERTIKRLHAAADILCVETEGNLDEEIPAKGVDLPQERIGALPTNAPDEHHAIEVGKQSAEILDIVLPITVHVGDDLLARMIAA